MVELGLGCVEFSCKVPPKIRGFKRLKFVFKFKLNFKVFVVSFLDFMFSFFKAAFHGKMCLAKVHPLIIPKEIQQSLFW